MVRRGGGSGSVQQQLLRATGMSNSATLTSSVVQREPTGPTFSSGHSSSGHSSSGRDASAFTDNRRELAFAAILALVGIAALYPTLKLGSSSEPARVETAKSIALNPRHWVRFAFQDSQRVTHNTRIYRFLLDSNMSLGLHPASYLLTRAQIDISGEGRPEEVIRAYTPISDPHVKGHFDLMIKFYPEGIMSRHIARLEPGDTLEVRGPVGELQYEANMKKYLGMIAGEIGITPMLQVITAIMSNPKDNTQVSLVYENESPEDILLKDKLDALAQAHPNFKVFYTVEIASREWTGGLGRVGADTIVKGLPRPSDDTLILVCGPPRMMDLICGAKAKERHHRQVVGLLRELGFKNDQVYKF